MANHRRKEPHTIASFRITRKVWAKFAKVHPNRSETIRDYIDKEIDKYDAKNEGGARK